MNARNESLSMIDRPETIRRPILSGLIVMIGFANPYLFYVLNAFFGIKYLGSESSAALAAFIFLVSALMYSFFLRSIVTSKVMFNFRDLSVLFLPVIVSASFLASTLIGGSINHLALKYYISFVSYAVPAIVGGFCVGKFNLFSSFAKWLEILMVLLSVSIIQNVIIPLLEDKAFISLGGASYQTMSYLSALALGLNLYFLLLGNRHKRFSIFEIGFYKVICIFLIPNQIVGLVSTGGRGGLVLGVIYLCLVTFYIVSSNESHRKKLRNYWLITLLTILIILIIWPVLEETYMFASGFSRISLVFAGGSGFINPVGIGGRDILFQESLSLISKRPFVGYGCFGIWDLIEFYPHNLFLDILLHGGLFYFIFVVVFMFLFFRKLLLEVRKRSELKLAVVLLLFPFVMLMFSGTYIESAQLWFVIAFVLTSNSNSGQSKRLKQKAGFQNELSS